MKVYWNSQRITANPKDKEDFTFGSRKKKEAKREKKWLGRRVVFNGQAVNEHNHNFNPRMNPVKIELKI